MNGDYYSKNKMAEMADASLDSSKMADASKDSKLAALKAKRKAIIGKGRSESMQVYDEAMADEETRKLWLELDKKNFGKEELGLENDFEDVTNEHDIK